MTLQTTINNKNPTLLDVKSYSTGNKPEFTLNLNFGKEETKESYQKASTSKDIPAASTAPLPTYLSYFYNKLCEEEKKLRDEILFKGKTYTHGLTLVEKLEKFITYTLSNFNLSFTCSGDDKRLISIVQPLIKISALKVFREFPDADEKDMMEVENMYYSQLCDFLYKMHIEERKEIGERLLAKYAPHFKMSTEHKKYFETQEGARVYYEGSEDFWKQWKLDAENVCRNWVHPVPFYTGPYKKLKRFLTYHFPYSTAGLSILWGYKNAPLGELWKILRDAGNNKSLQENALIAWIEKISVTLSTQRGYAGLSLKERATLPLELRIEFSGISEYELKLRREIVLKLVNRFPKNFKWDDEKKLFQDYREGTKEEYDIYEWNTPEALFWEELKEGKE